MLEHARSASDAPHGLPPPSGGTGETTSYLDLSEKLGPLIINADGTTARIANWADLTPVEQERTRRRIVARNRQRLAALRSEEL